MYINCYWKNFVELWRGSQERMPIPMNCICWKLCKDMNLICWNYCYHQTMKRLGLLQNSYWRVLNATVVKIILLAVMICRLWIAFNHADSWFHQFLWCYCWFCQQLIESHLNINARSVVEFISKFHAPHKLFSYFVYVKTTGKFARRIILNNI